MTTLTIKTERLILRPIQKDDADRLFQYRSNFESNKYQSWIPETLAETSDWIENNVEKELNKPDSWFQFVVLKKADELMIGDLGIHFMNLPHQIEIGFTFDANYNGVGFASEATKAVINYICHQFNKTEVFAYTDPKNIRSIQLLERIGFTKKEFIKNSYQLRGDWVDDLVYQLIFESKNR